MRSSGRCGLREPPTAAVCFNDAVAFGVCDGLRARRLEPGDDFAVVGFDDVIEAKTAVPALTTVSVDPQGMGRRAAQLLLKQINAGTAEPETIVSCVRLVVRESCGAGIDKGRSCDDKVGFDRRKHDRPGMGDRRDPRRRRRDRFGDEHRAPSAARPMRPSTALPSR